MFVISVIMTFHSVVLRSSVQYLLGYEYAEYNIVSWRGSIYLAEWAH